MLAALIANNQNVQPQPKPRRIEIDLGGGGGGPNRQMYDIVDYMNVLATFRDIPGEHAVARAQRRTEHVRDGLRQQAETREQKERDLAAAMMLGAQLGHAAASEETAAAQARYVMALEDMERVTAALEAMRERAERAELAARAAASDGIGAGGMLTLFALGLGAGVVLSRRRRR